MNKCYMFLISPALYMHLASYNINGYNLIDGKILYAYTFSKLHYSCFKEMRNDKMFAHKKVDMDNDEKRYILDHYPLSELVDLSVYSKDCDCGIIATKNEYSLLRSLIMKKITALYFNFHDYAPLKKKYIKALNTLLYKDIVSRNVDVIYNKVIKPDYLNAFIKCYGEMLNV